MPEPGPAVAVLLATFNGGRFLREQLHSLAAQRGVTWTLFWRDDGSSDDTVAIVTAFIARIGQGVRVAAPVGRIGPTDSFLLLLSHAAAAMPDAVVAFADQDDVWLEDKLRRGLRGLEGPAGPAIYCSRQILVNESLQVLRPSAPLREPPGFAAALTQNIATGCTVMLNPDAVALLTASRAPSATLHDWWCYLVVMAAGGRLVLDQEPSVLYRQHAANMIGAPQSLGRRATAALLRGPDMFMNVLRGHVAALLAQPALLSAEAAGVLASMQAGLHGGWAERRQALRLPGLSRQTGVETALFRWWFLVG